MAGRPWTPEEQATAEVAAACGVSIKTIGRALGRWDSVVVRHLRPAAAEQGQEATRRWREVNRDHCREYSRRWYEANREKELERKRRWREADPERAREMSRRWREADPERAREVVRRWREANSERHRGRLQRWREANPEKMRDADRRWREANRGRKRECLRRWREANPERVREVVRRRRARERAANRRALVPVQSHQQLQQHFALFGNRCAYCGATEKLTVDHVLALNAGGLDEPGNIAPACSRCNSSKGARPVEVWYKSQPFFSDTRWRKLRKHCPGVEAGQLPLSLAA